MIDDVETLYRELQPSLWRILTGNLHADQALLEDACQIAWSRLLRCRDSVAPGCELAWLSTTATRALLAALREQRRTESLGDRGELLSLDDFRARAPEPERALELGERLAEIRRLPLRQQRMVWLQGAGYAYAEIAAATGDSCRTVERQLTRARQRLLHLADDD